MRRTWKSRADRRAAGAVNDQRAAAAKALAGAFEHAGRHAVLVDASAPSNAICAANKATAQVAAWLDPAKGVIKAMVEKD